MGRSVAGQNRHAHQGPLASGLTALAVLSVLVVTGCSAPDGEQGHNESPQPDATGRLLTDGGRVFARACAACHENGLVGAPRIGDRNAWAPRIATGKATLVEHAINGFRGDSGFMPPKGGHAYLDDGEIAAAVEFMIEQAR
jgi:cytochrome c5